jgi:hypothetical protein
MAVHGWPTSAANEGATIEQAEEGGLAQAPDQGEEARREAPHVDARPAPVTDAPEPLLLALVDDLMVRSRIDAAAGLAGVEVLYVRTSDEIRAAVAGRPARALLVGMATTRRPWPDVLRQLRADAATRDLYVLAFGPHMNLGLRAQALEAGADRVVANSAFIRLLPTILAAPTTDVPDE